ncbi:MAG: hypothetical protein WCL18_00005 [bacterium]
MKNLIFFCSLGICTLAICAIVLQGCGKSAAEMEQEKMDKLPSVVKLDPAGNVSYQWSSVDTSGGFTTIATGIMGSADDRRYLDSEDATKSIDGLLRAFEKKFQVRVTNHVPFVMGVPAAQTNTYLWLRVWFTKTDTMPRQMLKLNEAMQKLESRVHELTIKTKQLTKEVKRMRETNEEKK